MAAADPKHDAEALVIKEDPLSADSKYDAEALVVDENPLLASSKHNTEALVSPLPAIAAKHNTGTLVIEEDPLSAIATNDLHRQHDAADGPNSDLWSLDQWEATFPHAKQTRGKIPVVAPVGWIDGIPVSQTQYNQDFNKKFKMISMLLPIDNVVVAGGAAAYPLTTIKNYMGDVDLFIYGIDPTNRAALWRKVSEIADRLLAASKTLTNDVLNIDATLTMGVVTFVINRDSKDKAGSKDRFLVV